MDLKHPTTIIPHHDQCDQTPPHSPPINGKTHHHPPPPCAAVVYKECLKNHAAGIGGHAVDGCGEFMPSPSYTPSEPSSYTCAACGCHRNFHRREPTTDYIATATRPQFIDFNRHRHPSTTPSPPSLPRSYGQHLVLSLSTAADQTHTVATPGTPVEMKISGRKRFRTKFTQDQKEKMQTFAEKLGWKMQRCDDKMVADFCNEIGIRRGIFKVWMHNNKNTLAKRDKSATATATATTTLNTTANAVVAAALVDSNDSGHQEHGSSSIS